MAWYRNFLENFQKIRKLSNYFLIEKKLAKIKFGYTCRAEVPLFFENFGSVPFPSMQLLENAVPFVSGQF